MEVQVGQSATIMGRLEAQGSGKLPSQPVVNPRKNASVITLRSDIKLEKTSRKSKEATNEALQAHKDLGLVKDDATTHLRS